MEVLKGQHYLGGVKTCVWFTANGERRACPHLRSKQNPEPLESGGPQASPEPSDSPQVREHLSTWNILHHHVKV